MANVFKQYEEERIAGQGNIEEMLTKKAPEEPETRPDKPSGAESGKAPEKAAAAPGKTKKTARKQPKDSPGERAPVSVCILLDDKRHMKIKLYAVRNRTTVSRLVREWIDSLDG